MKKHFLLLGFLLTLLPFQMLLAQSRTINGTVSDAKKGNYSMNATSDKDVLVFSCVGFISQEITLGTQTQVNVTLAEDVQMGIGTKADNTKIFEFLEVESIKLGRNTDYLNGMFQDGMIQSDQLAIFKPFHALRPIPQVQIDRVTGNASAFSQNPGY
jgi:hypothetical protein